MVVNLIRQQKSSNYKTIQTTKAMSILEKAAEFENRKFSFKTTSDRILAAREAKDYNS